jgi:hypothetical protein
VRVKAQLIDTDTDRFEEDLADLFKLQDQWWRDWPPVWAGLWPTPRPKKALAPKIRTSSI